PLKIHFLAGFTPTRVPSKGFPSLSHSKVGKTNAHGRELITMAWLNNLRLNSSDPEVRSKAVQNLDGSANSRDTDRIYASLTDQSPQVRCAAIRALEKAHNQHSVRSMIGALRDVSHQVREAV